MKNFKKLLVTLGVFGGLAFAGTAANADTVYTVQSGDTLSEISQKFNTTVETLAQKNNINNVDVISVGQQLDIPDGNTQGTVSKSIVEQPIQNETVQSQQQNNVKQETNVQPTVVQQQSQANQTQSDSNLGSAAEQIAQAESGGDYNARNGQYIGKYQLSASYLNGDYSPANQDRVFQQYCNQRYGSVENALAFRQSHGWY